MNRELDAARRVLAHRIAGHRAALRAFERLGRPERLQGAVLRTAAAIAECEAVLSALDAHETPEQVQAEAELALWVEHAEDGTRLGDERSRPLA